MRAVPAGHRKLEARISNIEASPNDLNAKAERNRRFGFVCFGLVSDFGFRVVRLAVLSGMTQGSVTAQRL